MFSEYSWSRYFDSNFGIKCILSTPWHCLQLGKKNCSQMPSAHIFLVILIKTGLYYHFFMLPYNFWWMKSRKGGHLFSRLFYIYIHITHISWTIYTKATFCCLHSLLTDLCIITKLFVIGTVKFNKYLLSTYWIQGIKEASVMIGVGLKRCSKFDKE